MPLKMNEREYRSMTLMRAAEDAEEYIVEGYATTFDAPYLLFEEDGVKYFECVARAALNGADVSDVLMLYDHQGKVLARNSNGTLRLTPDEHGLHIRASLGGSAAARDLYEEIKNGLVTKMSWAFVVDDWEYDERSHTRTIKHIRKVYDVSAVSRPANIDTDISARSALDGVIKREQTERSERQKLLLKLKLEGIA